MLKCDEQQNFTGVIIALPTPCPKCGTPIPDNWHICSGCLAVYPSGVPRTAVPAPPTTNLPPTAPHSASADPPSPPSTDTIVEKAPKDMKQVDSQIPLLPGEEILWHRDFSHGIFHRAVTVEEAVTNRRCLKYDAEHGKAIAQVSIANMPEVVIMNTRRVSNSLGGGVYLPSRMFLPSSLRGLGGFGVYGGPRRGSSKAFGNVSIMVNGVVAMTFEGVEDPQGLRQLIMALKREQHQQQRY